MPKRGKVKVWSIQGDRTNPRMMLANAPEPSATQVVTPIIFTISTSKEALTDFIKVKPTVSCKPPKDRFDHVPFVMECPPALGEHFTVKYNG